MCAERRGAAQGGAGTDDSNPTRVHAAGLGTEDVRRNRRTRRTRHEAVFVLEPRRKTTSSLSEHSPVSFLGSSWLAIVSKLKYEIRTGSVDLPVKDEIITPSTERSAYYG